MTADEWLAEHRADQAEKDEHRGSTDEDTDQARPDDADHVLSHPDRVAGDDVGRPAETAVPDVRETAVAIEQEYADRQPQADVLDADETAARVARAQVALAELAARRDSERAEQDAEDERRGQLARWAEQDRAAREGDLADREDQEPVRERRR